MNNIKKHLNGILLCLFELVVGVLLLINPVGFTTGIIIAAGIGLLVLGLVCVIKYCRTESATAAKEQNLLKGLLALTAGCFCVFNTQWFVEKFPDVTVVYLYGIAVLVAGLVKIQLAVDMLRAGNKRWFLGLIGAVVSAACAAVILKVSFNSLSALWLFTGISLIVEAVVDAATMIVSNIEPEKEEKTEE